jgi:Barrel-sandwich domain of CusB or HlyD membrane-fusion/GAF domain
MANLGGESPLSADERNDASSLGRVSFLEQALWKQFNDATTPEEFSRAWLGLQCALIAGVERGVVVLKESENGPFAPVAYWPIAGAGSASLSAAAELALAERRGVAQGQDDAGQASPSQPWCVAYPIIVDEKLFGVAAVEIEPGRRVQLRSVMRQLQWGVGWIEVLLRRAHMRGEKVARERIAVAFDLVAVALEKHRFQDACKATVTELATRLDCDQVSIGFLKRQKIVVAAVSHLAQFGRRMNLVRTIGRAMDEAVDQRATVCSPAPQEWEYRIDLAHRELARINNDGVVLTVPLHAGGRFFGALTFERPPGAVFDEDAITLCDCVANIVGPVLEEKRQNDRLIVIKLFESLLTQLQRLFGPHYIGRKLATALAVVVLVFFAVFKMDYAVTAPAALEGSVQRVIVAPSEGYIASQNVRAGDVVHTGDLMATLDDKDLVIERLKWSTKNGEQEKEYGKALAKQERADASIIKVQIEQATAQISLLDEMIKRTRLLAPFEGQVISGDLSQSIGAAVKRGDELFQVAPLDSYRVILKVDERDIADIRPDQTGTLLVTSIPLQPLHYKVTRVTPIAEAEEGVNSFRVEASLVELSDRLRPGMKGVGKTTIEQRLLINIWTNRLVHWVRITSWKWLP